MEPEQPLDGLALARAELALKQAQFEAQQRAALAQMRLQRLQLWASSAALGVPLLIGAATLVFSALNQRTAAQTQLELKALETVMAAEGPYAAASRVQALRRLGIRLPPAFDSVSTLENIGAPGRERRLAILQLLAEHPADRDKILATADVLFPDTDFIHQLMRRSAQGTPPPTR